MANVILRRNPSIWNNSSEDDPAAGFAAECQGTLKYRVLARRRTVAQALKDLNMAPLCRKSVDQYMKSRERSPGGYVGSFLLAVLFVHLLLLPVAAVLQWIGFTVAWIWLWAVLGIVLPLVVFTVVAAFNGAFGVRRTWVLVHLSDYEQVIPRYALQTAMDVRAKLKEVRVPHRWFVHELQSHPDPFLVLRVRGAGDYYMEAWNEPNFDLQREI